MAAIAGIIYTGVPFMLLLICTRLYLGPDHSSHYCFHSSLKAKPISCLDYGELVCDGKPLLMFNHLHAVMQNSILGSGNAHLGMAVALFHNTSYFVLYSG